MTASENPIVGVILLRSPEWNPEIYAARLSAGWGISADADAIEKSDGGGSPLMIRKGGMLAWLQLMEERLPAREKFRPTAEAKSLHAAHAAHVVCVVTGDEEELRKARFFAAVTGAFCEDEQTLGVLSEEHITPAAQWLADAKAYVRTNGDELPWGLTVFADPDCCGGVKSFGLERYAGRELMAETPDALRKIAAKEAERFDTLNPPGNAK
ncbi:MAG: hypothetical protein ACFWTZ_09560 [Burkholderia sp.]|jgi:hypothetical protein